MLRKNIPEKIYKIIQLIASLDDKERKLLLARFYYDKTLKQVAEQRGITSARVKQIEDELIKDIQKQIDYRNI
jgi:RNA polymerase sigma factor (sigma-70 family)